ncbi:MAG: TonB-dependent receptor [Sphingomonadales bacterium]|nr:MAG: TonB-dependent receptor [Sphingomonadales bacterium]
MTFLRSVLITCTSVTALAWPVFSEAQVNLSHPEGTKAAATVDDRRVYADDIIVTATRRSESILDVPLSITAYSQESLDTQGVKNIEDLVRVTPGVQLVQGFSNQTIISIRGLTSAIGAATTGIYIDDTPVQVRSISLQSNFYPSIFDLERVEVLKGPQGTLFGSGAMGGAIRFILAKPGLTEFSGYARGEVATTEGGAISYQGGAAIGGPLVQDRLGFRASLHHRRDGGYVDRAPDTPGFGTAEKNANWREEIVGNFALGIAPTEQILITPSVFYQEKKQHDTDQYWRLIPDPDREEFINGNPFNSPYKDRAVVWSFKVEADLGALELISNTSYLARNTHTLNEGTAYFLEALGLPYDFNLGGALAATLDLRTRQRSFTQELRIQSHADSDSRLKYVLGLFYQNSRQKAFEEDVSAGISDAFLGSSDPLLASVDDQTRDKQFAAFGQIDFELIENLTASAGVRVSRIKSRFTNQTGGAFYGGLGPLIRGRSTETPITPKFGLEYRVAPDWMVYGSAAKGFRPGGGNPMAPPNCAADLAAIGLTAAPSEYRSDSAWSYELGLKGRAGRALTFASSLFNIDWSNNQNGRLLRTCGFRYIDNLGSVRSRGADADITLRPVEGVSLGARVSYTDTEFRETIFSSSNPDPADPNEPVLVRRGRKLTEPWNISLNADYEGSIGSGNLVAYSHVQYDYKAALDYDKLATDFDPVVDRPNATNFVSARIGMRGGPLDVSLFVNNLLDSKDVVGGSRVGSTTPRFLEQSFRPRTFGATASYRF